MTRLLWRASVILTAVAGLWQFCVVPFRFEINLRQMERRTYQALRLSEPRRTVVLRRLFQESHAYSKSFPSDVRLAMVEGSAARLHGNLSAAAAAYQRALRYDRRPEIYLNLALVQKEAGQQDDAARNLAQALRAAPHMAEDVPDIMLIRDAVAVMRGTDAPPPFCCGADYDGDGKSEVLDLRSTFPVLLPGGRMVPVPPGWTPEFAWNEQNALNLVVRETETHATRRLRLSARGELKGQSELPPLGSGWQIVAMNRVNQGESLLLLTQRETQQTRIWRLKNNGTVLTEAAPQFTQTRAYLTGCARLIVRHDSTGRIMTDTNCDALFRSYDGHDYLRMVSEASLSDYQQDLPCNLQRELVAAADFTGDSSPDLLWYDYELQRLILWVMRSTQIERVVLWPQPDSVHTSTTRFRFKETSRSGSSVGNKVS